MIFQKVNFSIDPGRETMHLWWWWRFEKEWLMDEDSAWCYPSVLFSLSWISEFLELTKLSTQTTKQLDQRLRLKSRFFKMMGLQKNYGRFNMGFIHFISVSTIFLSQKVGGFSKATGRHPWDFTLVLRLLWAVNPSRSSRRPGRLSARPGPSGFWLKNGQPGKGPVQTMVFSMVSSNFQLSSQEKGWKTSQLRKPLWLWSV